MKDIRRKRFSVSNDFTRRGLSLLLMFSFIATVIGFSVAYCEHKNYKELLLKYDESIERISQCEVSISALMTSQTDFTDTTQASETDTGETASQTTSHQEAEAVTQTSPENETAASTTAETPSGYYVTQSGKKYHVASCSYLNKSKISISLERIRAEGYSPCSRCIK